MKENVSAGEVRRHVAARLRQRRRYLDLSQAALGAIVGMSHQQVAEKETAKRSLTVANLRDFAAALEVPLDYFFEGLGKSAATPPEPPAGKRSAARLVQSFNRLATPAQNQLLAFLETLVPDSA